MMNSGGAEIDKMLFCASCGIAGGDDVKLKDCSACKLVKYCGIECQKEHRPKHKKECKKRAAELRDELLFKQPESSHNGDCPICLVPLPLDEGETALTRCCCKVICFGCQYGHQKRELEEGLETKCPFCRSEYSSGEANIHLTNLTMRRAEANDLVALHEIGKLSADEGNFDHALECFTKAVAIGNYVGAHYQLSKMYRFGHGVEKNEKKEVYHLEEAAIGGDAIARNNLGCIEERNGRLDRAVKHWIIAANMGLDQSLENVKMAYRKGLVSKGDLASALRAHKAAVDATKSPQREEAEAARKRF